MFWFVFSVILQILSGLFRIGRFREWVSDRFPEMDNFRLDMTGYGLLLIGIAIGVLSFVGQIREKKALVSRLNNVQTQVAKNEYRPFPEELRKKTTENLRIFAGNSGIPLKIRIFFPADRNRELVAHETAKMIRASGIFVAGPDTGTIMGQGMPPMVVKSNKESALLASSMIEILRPVLDAKDRAKSFQLDGIPTGVLELFLIGTPRFEPDGRVILE